MNLCPVSSLQPKVFQRLCALHKSLRTAAVYLVKGGCEERGWLCGSATVSVLQPGRAALCTRLIYLQWGKRKLNVWPQDWGVRIIPFLLCLRIIAVRVFLQGGHCWYWWRCSELPVPLRWAMAYGIEDALQEHECMCVCVIEWEQLNGCVFS